MNFREATVNDIKQIHVVRNAVTENPLSNPDLITHQDYVNFMTVRGKGWVCEIENKIVGFAIVDLMENNIWALFILPDYEKKGIGLKLQNMMLKWYFNQTQSKLWLGTSPDTRAEQFYRKSGWIEVGTHGEEEMKFEMTSADWKAREVIHS